MAETPNTFMLLLRLGLSLGVVLAFVGAVTWALRRRGLLRPGAPAGPTQRLQVVDRRSLGKRSSVVVARIGDVSVLLGVTDQQVNVLARSSSADGSWAASDPAAAAAALPAAGAASLASTASAAGAASLAGAAAPLPPAAIPGSAVETAAAQAAGRTGHDLLRTPRRCSTDAAASAASTTTGFRRTGTQEQAQGAGTTPTRMSFVEALKELTVRTS